MSIQDKLINNYVTSFIWYGYKFLKYRIPMLISSIYPVNRNKTIFMSFNGKNYADNPRAVSEKMHEMYPKHEIVWGMNDLEHAKTVVPDYVKVVKYGSFDWYREVATSGAWVFNVLMPHGILKRKGQKYIQTWHGDRGFKKIVFDATGSMEQFKKRSYFRRIVEPDLCDAGVVGSEFGRRFFRSAFHYRGQLLDGGCPRNDCLVNESALRQVEVKEKIGIGADVKVLMYAPTFRDHNIGKKQNICEIDFDKVLDKLEKKTNTQWICILRAHTGSSFVKHDYSERIVDLSFYEDMADLLCITDLLITDYSSTPGDLALRGVGSILLQVDYDDFTSQDRKLYFDMESSPFWVAHTNDEAYELINSWTEERAKENARAILSFYETHETGHAAMDVVNYIKEN